MAERKTAPGKKKKKKNSLSQTITAIFTTLLLLGGAGLAVFIFTKKIEGWQKGKAEEAAQKKLNEQLAKEAKEREANGPPHTLVNDSVEQTIAEAARRGWKPCPGHCLQLSMPGWHHEDVPGHPPTDVWYKFYHSGGYHMFSQGHCGHIIKEYYDQGAKDVGVCPVCNGVGWVPIGKGQASAADTTSNTNAHVKKKGKAKARV